MDLATAIRIAVDAAPPFSPEQRLEFARLLSPSAPAGIPPQRKAAGVKRVHRNSLAVRHRAVAANPQLQGAQ